VAELPAPRPPGEDVVTVACREFVELVTEHLEGTLPDQVQAAIAAHLELCDPCVVYLEQMRSTAAALRGVPAPTLPDAARQRLLDVFSALHASDGQGGGPADRKAP
jgi:anti-sigma factor RsiW